MSQPLLPYAVPAKLQSPLLHESPDTIPPTDELEAVQNELKLLKQKSLERARKADGDLKAIEIAIKKLRAREKGKSKVKREQSCTFNNLYLVCGPLLIQLIIVAASLSPMTFVIFAPYGSVQRMNEPVDLHSDLHSSFTHLHSTLWLFGVYYHPPPPNHKFFFVWGTVRSFAGMWYPVGCDSVSCTWSHGSQIYHHC